MQILGWLVNKLNKINSRYFNFVFNTKFIFNIVFESILLGYIIFSVMIVCPLSDYGNEIQTDLIEVL